VADDGNAVRPGDGQLERLERGDRHWVPSSIDDCGSFFHLTVEQSSCTFTAIRETVGQHDALYNYDSSTVNGVSHSWGLGGFTGRENGWGDVWGLRSSRTWSRRRRRNPEHGYDAFRFEMAVRALENSSRST